MFGQLVGRGAAQADVEVGAGGAAGGHALVDLGLPNLPNLPVGPGRTGRRCARPGQLAQRQIAHHHRPALRVVGAQQLGRPEAPVAVVGHVQQVAALVL